MMGESATGGAIAEAAGAIPRRRSRWRSCGVATTTCCWSGAGGADAGVASSDEPGVAALEMMLVVVDTICATGPFRGWGLRTKSTPRQPTALPWHPSA